MIHEWADQCVCLPELEPDDPPALYPRRMVERSEARQWVLQKPLVGQISQNLSSPVCKNIPLNMSGKSVP